MTFSVHHYLAQAKLFAGLAESHRDQLAAICETAELKKRAVLFREGDTGESIFILVGGSVQLHKTGPEGKDTVIKIIKPGELFAEVVLFEQAVYPVTATALSTSRVVSIPKRHMLALLTKEDFRNDFVAGLMRKLRYLSDRISYLSTHDLEDRFRMFIIDQFGPQKHVSCSLSKRDVASAIGATPESLSRLLYRLKQDGMLTWSEGVITASPEFWERHA